MKYRVADGTQVHYDGVTYGAGETVEAEESIAAAWVTAGWVTPAMESKPAKRTSRKST